MEPQNQSNQPNKKVGIIIGVIVVLGVLGVIVFSRTTPPATSPNPPLTGEGGSGSPAGAGEVTSYTLAQVATHKDATSCWTIIRTGVYDVTTWINQHPGGPEAILSLCGKDGTAAFEGQHGGQSQPENELKTFFIGNYQQ